jgi:hypothetical protein
MQITIDLPPDLERELIRQAAQSNIPLQTLVLRALRQLAQTTPDASSQWSDIVLSYEGIPDFPAFESGSAPEVRIESRQDEGFRA